jgi:hypothetical protein
MKDNLFEDTHSLLCTARVQLPKDLSQKIFGIVVLGAGYEVYAQCNLEVNSDIGICFNYPAFTWRYAYITFRLWTVSAAPLFAAFLCLSRK